MVNVRAIPRNPFRWNRGAAVIACDGQRHGDRAGRVPRARVHGQLAVGKAGPATAVAVTSARPARHVTSGSSSALRPRAAGLPSYSHAAAMFTFSWSASEGRWRASMDGKPARAAERGQLSAPTVVIQQCLSPRRPL